MNQLVINNIDDALLARLKQSAAARGVSTDEQVKTILDQWLIEIRFASKKDLLTEMDEILEKYAHLQKTDSVELLRKDRDR